jgi:hypothetical protein
MNKPATSPEIRDERTPKPTLEREEISARAHSIWEEEGCPDGRDLEHWLKAERELESAAGRMSPGDL